MAAVACAFVLALAIAPALEVPALEDGHVHCLVHGSPVVLPDGVSLRVMAGNHVRVFFDYLDRRAILVDSIFVPPRV